MENVKKIVYGLSISVVLVLAGCGQKDEVQEKQDFYIQVKPLSGFTNQITVEKSATLDSDQNIMVTAQAHGRVDQILVKNGEVVKEGQVIVQLKDDVANYGLAVQRAKTALNSARLQYKNVKIGLNKTIADSQLNVEKTKVLLDSVKDIGVQTVKNAEQGLNSANTRLVSMKSQFSSEHDKIKNLFQTVLDFSDQLLGYSTIYQSMSHDFQHLISAKNPIKKTKAKQMLAELYIIRDNISRLSSGGPAGIDNKTLLNNLILIQGAYTKISAFLIQMNEVMIDTVDGKLLPKSKIDGFVATINHQKTNTQQLLASFNAYKGQVETVLSDVKNPGKNTFQESAKIGYETTKLKTTKNLKDAKLALDNANTTYATALQSKDAQLKLLATTIQQAEITYQDAQTLYGKLTVKSPISGVIGDVMVDKGQEIRIGTPMFSISNEKEQLIDMYVSVHEYKYLKVGDTAHISYNKEIYTGAVHSIASIASRNGLYKVKIVVKSKIQLLGGIADIRIPVHVDGLWLPVNMITIVGENVGYIRSYDNKKLMKHTVTLGEIWGDNVKILNSLTGNILITSDLENYEPAKYSLMIK